VDVSQIESAAALAGSEFEIVELSALREVSSGADLLLATGSSGVLSFEVIRGETYAIRVTGRGGFSLRAALTPATNNSTRPFLSDSIGNATTELLGQVFTRLVSSGQDFSADELSEAVLTEFFAASGGQDNLQERFLLLYVDPVDFVLESSTGDQAGFTADRGQLDQYGNTFYSGDAVTELLVIPQADAGRYSLQLEGLGQDVRGGASLVSSAGVISRTFEFRNLTGRTVLPLDFPETPAQTVVVVNFLPPETLIEVVQQLSPILLNLTNDLRVLVPVDLPDWDFGLPFESTDAEPDWLLPAVAPGMSGLAEAMSRFGELFGELLLPIITASDDAAEEEPADEPPDDADSDAAASERSRKPAGPAELDEAGPASSQPDPSEPTEKTSQIRTSRAHQAVTVAENRSSDVVRPGVPRERKRVADVWL
jgi:hypothetical protein